MQTEARRLWDVTLGWICSSIYCASNVASDCSRLANSKTSTFMKVITLVENHLIKCTWLPGPSCCFLIPTEAEWLYLFFHMTARKPPKDYDLSTCYCLCPQKEYFPVVRMFYLYHCCMCDRAPHITRMSWVELFFIRKKCFSLPPCIPAYWLLQLHRLNH